MTEMSRRACMTSAAGLLAACAGATRSRTSMSTLKEDFDLERFVAEVRRARSEHDSQSAVQEVLARAVSDPASVIRALGEPSDPGIHTLHHGEDVTILNVIWAPLMVLLPHNHNMWASIGIYTGREDNILWKREGAVAEAYGASSLSEREVFGLPVDAIHSVTNPIGRLTGAIHVYGGDFFAPGRSEWDAESLRERPFDLEAARKSFADANRRFKAGL